MAVITTGNHPKALWPGVKVIWGTKYDEFPTEYTDLFDTESGDMHYIELVQTTGFGLASVKEQGASVAYDTDVQGFVTRATHVTYGLGYIVTWEELEDNRYMVLAKGRAARNAFSMRTTKETVAGNFFNNAFSAAFPMGDGAALISSAHPNTSGGTFSNLISADLSELAIEDMCIQIMGATNDRGLRINLMPKKLIVPRQLWFEANRILYSVLQNDTANNSLNVLKSTNAIPGGVCVNHFFTDSDAWFIRTNVPEGGLIHSQRTKILFEQDNDFDTKNAKSHAVERYVFVCGDPRAVYGSAGV